MTGIPIFATINSQFRYSKCTDLLYPFNKFVVIFLNYSEAIFNSTMNLENLSFSLAIL